MGLNHECPVSYILCQHMVSYDLFCLFSEFNKENKINQHAKSCISGKGFEVDEEDPKFLEDLNESDEEEEEEEGDDFEVGDEYDNNRVS